MHIGLRVISKHATTTITYRIAFNKQRRVKYREIKGGAKSSLLRDKRIPEINSGKGGKKLETVLPFYPSSGQ